MPKKWTQMNLKGLGALVTVLTLALTGLAPAAPNDGVLGGIPTTDTAATSCPPGKAVTGVTGSIGTVAASPVVATVTVQCAGGSAVGSIGTYSGPEGSGSTSCGAGEVAVGIQGREGDFIDQLAVRCRPADLIGSTTAAGSFGGTGGSLDGPYDCSSGQVLGGLNGSVSSPYAREVSISCFAPDRDGDGVPDSADACPLIAATTANGCPPSSNQGPADTTPPTARLSGKKKQKLRKTVTVTVSCDEACSATATGTLNVPNLSSVYKLRKATATIAAGGTVKLKLALSKKARRNAKRALKRRRKVRANTTVVAVDTAGNQTIKKQSVTLTLR
jgi:hypothetical protein